MLQKSISIMAIMGYSQGAGALATARSLERKDVAGNVKGAGARAARSRQGSRVPWALGRSQALDTHLPIWRRVLRFSLERQPTTTPYAPHSRSHNEKVKDLNSRLSIPSSTMLPPWHQEKQGEPLLTLGATLVCDLGGS